MIREPILRADAFGDPEGPSGLLWVTVHPHPEDADLWLCVAADYDQPVGSLDVWLHGEGPFGAEMDGLVLHCSAMVWIHRQDLATRFRYLRRIEPWWIADVEARLRSVLAGAVGGTDATRAVDEDPAYQSHLEALDRSAARLQHDLLVAPQAEVATGAPRALRLVPLEIAWESVAAGGGGAVIPGITPLAIPISAGAGRSETAVVEVYRQRDIVEVRQASGPTLFWRATGEPLGTDWAPLPGADPGAELRALLHALFSVRT